MSQARLIIKTEVVPARGNQAAYGVFTVPSDSRPGVQYRVDITNGRCSCPAWTNARAGSGGKRRLCKHLIGAGYRDTTVTA